jgi:hypothetical protein
MVLIGLILCQGSAIAQLRDIDLGATISDGRLRSFYLAISDHHRIAARQVVEIRDRPPICLFGDIGKRSGLLSLNPCAILTARYATGGERKNPEDCDRPVCR